MTIYPVNVIRKELNIVIRYSQGRRILWDVYKQLQSHRNQKNIWAVNDKLQLLAYDLEDYIY